MVRILDLGCGAHTWIARNNYIKNLHGFSTPLHDRYMSVGAGSRYICIDVQQEALDDAKKQICELSDVFLGKVEFRLDDIRSMKLPNEHFDTVILSDLLSVPESREDYRFSDGDPGEFLPILSRKEKLKIVDRAIETLKRGGELIITAYQTPEYMRHALLKLIGDSRLTIKEEWGNLEVFFDMGWDGTYNHCFYEAVFVKGGWPLQPTKQDLTEEQRSILQKAFPDDLPDIDF